MLRTILKGTILDAKIYPNTPKMQTKCQESQICIQNYKVLPKAGIPLTVYPSHVGSLVMGIMMGPEPFGTGLISTGFIIKMADLPHANCCAHDFDGLIDHVGRWWC